MATTVRASDDIDALDLPTRAYHACLRNRIRTVADLLELTPSEVLEMRGVGEGTLRDLTQRLEASGLRLASEPARVDPAAVAQAEWIGRQLVKLVSDRGFTKETLLSPADDRIIARRKAWAFYRWAVAADVKWPLDKAGGYVWMAHPMPGSLELHLEGLNRIAHEELD